MKVPTNAPLALALRRLLLSLWLGLLPGLFLGAGVAKAQVTSVWYGPDSPAQQLFNQVNSIVQQNYGGLSQVSRPALAQEYQTRLNAVCANIAQSCPAEKAYPVLQAELTALGDEHSFFDTPEDFRDFVASAVGGARLQFGVKLAELDGENRLVLEVVPNSSAQTVGLRRGDILRQLDGKPYQYTDLQAAREAGRTITLGVERLGKSLQLTLSPRESSTTDLPRLSYVGPQKDVALLRIPTFLSGGMVAQTVHNLVRQVQQKQAAGAAVAGMVVDLRGNTGGSLSECDSAVSAFVPDFSRIAHTSDGDLLTRVSDGLRLEDSQVAGYVRDPQLWTGPLTVLVDQGSASCSEFFAYEVQYAQRGLVVGEKTAGVGNTATHIFPLPDEAALQLTITHYLKPDGTPYPVRVLPDVLAAQDERALRLLAQGQDTLLDVALASLVTAKTLALKPKN